MSDNYIQKRLERMVIYAQTAPQPTEDVFTNQVNGWYLTVGQINQKELRGRVNMAIELFHNEQYSDGPLTRSVGLHAAIFASEAAEKPESQMIVQESQRRGYELPKDFDPVIFGIETKRGKEETLPEDFDPVTFGIEMKHDKEETIPRMFDILMYSLRLERYDPEG